MEQVLDLAVRDLSEVVPALVDLPGYVGLSKRLNKVVLVTADTITEEQRQAIQSALMAAVAAVDTSKPTPTQKKVANANQAISRIGGVDFQGAYDALQSANSVAGLRQALLVILLVLWRIAIANDWTNQDDPEA